MTSTIVTLTHIDFNSELDYLFIRFKY
jgi:hypothetical protein